MQRVLVTALIGLVLVAPALAQTNNSQTPDWRQQLGGLLSGNQDRDDAVRQAYERGYQRGRNDEARQQTNRQQRNDGNSYREEGRRYYNNR